MGHSNGGRFTYLLWQARGSAFAAFGPSGSPAVGMVRRFEPKPVFHIAGEKDQLVSYQSQKLTIDALRVLLTCGSPEDAKKSGYLTTEPGANGTEIATYVHPGGHEYPQAAVPMLVEFFKRHPKG
jgi:polyhydroxybutyrate depolymerase